MSNTKNIQSALTALRSGSPIILIDDEDRENEGDLIYAAELITPEKVNFMLQYCSGIVCLCLTQERLNTLQLPMMVPETGNTSRFGTGFTVSIEAKEGVTTGVSAFDRARTIQVAIDDSANANDLVRPGHVFPLRAQPGGVLERRGHTEASVDIVRLAGLKSAAVLCELMNSDGSMAKGAQIDAFAQAHQLVIVRIEELVQTLLASAESQNV